MMSKSNGTQPGGDALGPVVHAYLVEYFGNVLSQAPEVQIEASWL